MLPDMAVAVAAVASLAPYGRQDRFVPVQHGEWLAANVPGAEAEICRDDGHLSMSGRISEIHDWLLQYF